MMKKFPGIIVALFLISCNNQPNPCNYTPATLGSSNDALLDRVFLNIEYYFSNVNPDHRKDIYANDEFAKLSRGTNRKCVDDKLARKNFEITLESLNGTSATVSVRSRNPNDFNWFNDWDGTREAWNLVDGNWKLVLSLTAINADSEFIQTYFAD